MSNYYIVGGFDQMDIDRITNRRNWLKLFLEYNDCNIKASLDQLWNTCIWRKEKELNGTCDKELGLCNLQLIRETLLHLLIRLP